MHRRSRYEIVDFSSEDDNDDSKAPFCQHCLEYGFKVPLKNRIYPNNEPIPIDHDQFLQCHECGTIVPVYEIEKESSIKDVIETTDNPFDTGKDFLGIDSRKARKKRDRQKELDDIKDPDLKRELASGQTVLISYSEDT